MTKKYWNDWKKKKDDTKNIYMINTKNNHVDFYGIIGGYNEGIIKKIDFDEENFDIVKITMEKTLMDFNIETRKVDKIRVEREYKLHRTSIGRVTFNKYNSL